MSYNVTYRLPDSLVLGKSDVCFVVKENDEMLGEMRISKGSAVWFPANHIYGHRIKWSKLSDLIITHGIRVERR